MATQVDDTHRDDSRSRGGSGGWFAILKGAAARAGDDNLTLIAAGCAFYGLLALFPGITALISIWGLVGDPETVASQIEPLQRIAPEAVYEIVRGQVTSVAEGAGGSVTIGLIAGIALALWSATKGTKSLMISLGIVHGVEDDRGFVGQNAKALGLTALTVLAVAVALGLIVVVPALFAAVGLGATVETLVSLARWPLLLVGVTGFFAILYRYGPDWRHPPWKDILPGAAIAAALWIVASILFSVYVRNFGSYNATYGSLGAVVILLFWFWISALTALLGAEINAARAKARSGRPRLG